MAVSDAKQHSECVQRFIDLANSMKNENVPTRVVSAALMTASSVYTTYTMAGNNGGLNPSGIDKVTAVYRQSLENVQRAKREDLQRKQGQQQRA
jgi:hypothetical protein